MHINVTGQPACSQATGPLARNGSMFFPCLRHNKQTDLGCKYHDCARTAQAVTEMRSDMQGCTVPVVNPGLAQEAAAT
jgi:hypothetical protein